MPVRVVIRGDATEGDAPSLTFDSPRVVVGRSDACDVRLPDPSVSPRHATIRQHGGSWLLVDEGSTNGTFVGGVRLGAQAPRVLGDGDLVRVGRVWLEIRFDAATKTSAPQETKELALALVQRALSSMGESSDARVVCTEGPDQGKSLRVSRAAEPYVLGRGHGCDLLLDEPDASRRHLQVVRKGDTLLVRDLGSKNGTFLGESRLEIGKDATWRIGEVLHLGKDVLVYENPVADALAEIERSADEKMRDDEHVPAPRAPDEAPPPDETSAKPPEASANAPIAEVPKRRAAAKEEKKSGWGASDFVIVLLALGVLALSVAALWFLLRT